jgi:hypothetical protein
MLFEEFPDRITSMPTCSINIQPDSVSAKLTIKVLHHLEKSFSVATFGLDHSCTTQKRSYPSRNIQTLLMLAGRGNLQPFSDKRPTAAKPRMQGKTAFVLKNNGFFRPQRFEFFLGPWRTSSHLRLLLGDIHDWPASTGTRVDASSIAPDEPSFLHQSDAVNGLPMLGRPNGRDSNRTFGAILPDGVPTEPQFLASSWPVVPSAFSGSGLRPRPYSPPVSSGSRSSGSGPEPRISTLAAALRAQGAGWLSLCQSRLPVLSRPGPIVALLMPYEGSKGRYSCLPV